jgi:hypothetical protein
MILTTDSSPLREFLESFRVFIREHDISVEQGAMLGMPPKQRPELLTAWKELRNRWKEVDFLLSARALIVKDAQSRAIKSEWFREYVNAVDLYLKTPSYHTIGDRIAYRKMYDAHKSVIARLAVNQPDNSTKKGGRK